MSSLQRLSLLPLKTKGPHNQLPLQDLIQTSHVCRQWRRVQRKACRSRRSMVLLLKPNYQVADFSKPHLVHVASEYAQLDPPLCNWIVVNFVNLTSLKIYQISYKMLPQVAYLVQQYAPQLVTLKLTFIHAKGDKVDIFDESVSSHILKLINHINTMSQLKHLALHFLQCRIFQYYYDEINDYLDLPILAQLKLFDFASKDKVTILNNSFQAYGSLNPGLAIYNNNDINYQQTLFPLLQLNETLQKQFFKLNFTYFYGLPLQTLDTICRTFTSLNEIGVMHLLIPFLSLSQVATCFALLPNLTTVHLIMFSWAYFRIYPTEDEHQPKLPNVKILHLQLSVNRHSELAKIWSRLDSIYPKLEKVIFTVGHCITCGGMGGKLIPYDKVECAQQQIQTLPAKLRALFTDDTLIEESFQEH